MIKIKPYLLNLLFTIPVIIFTLYSCATKPNIPYPGRMSENFSKLENWNPLLASELRKLPEFQDGIAIQEEKALDDLVELYADNPKVFNNAFKQMYQIGKPDVRKYCSPLQALFWLSLEEDSETINYHIKNFRLRSLLNDAWDFRRNNLKGKYLDFSREEAKMVIRGYKEGWEDVGLPLDQFNNQILETYYEDPKQFDKETINLIKKSVKVDPKAIRWKKFSSVVDRLNAPELVDYYLDNNLTYRKAVAQGTYRIFKSKKGQCTDAAYFAYKILKNAGYKTFMRSVRWGTNDWNDVHTGSGIIMNEGQFILVADFGWEGVHGNSLSGPYENITDVDRRLSRGRRITHRAWGAFYPPR